MREPQLENNKSTNRSIGRLTNIIEYVVCAVGGGHEGSTGTAFIVVAIKDANTAISESQWYQNTYKRCIVITTYRKWAGEGGDWNILLCTDVSSEDDLKILSFPS